ncbi:hypothetical protein [Streptomyces sp. NPDC007984]|uniref:hypothetical protein n=1 Tax=Streptomyces sp. NPDC007984 TaxID=3364801 RepID=UPI0036E12D33
MTVTTTFRPLSWHIHTASWPKPGESRRPPMTSEVIDPSGGRGQGGGTEFAPTAVIAAAREQFPGFSWELVSTADGSAPVAGSDVITLDGQDRIKRGVRPAPR